ncbi:hypothetical protein PF70_03762, partial [Pseudomonas asplenii]
AMTREVLEEQADEHPVLRDQYAAILAHCAQLAPPADAVAGQPPHRA